MNYRWVYGCIISLWICRLACAQGPQIDNYSGALWPLPALTGDWGVRNTLTTKGINLEVDLLQDERPEVGGPCIVHPKRRVQCGVAAVRAEGGSGGRHLAAAGKACS